MTQEVLSSQDLKDIQQPLDKDGYSNDDFDKLYGKDKNPYITTERDRKNKKSSGKMITISAEVWERIFGSKNENNQRKIHRTKKGQLGQRDIILD